MTILACSFPIKLNLSLGDEEDVKFSLNSIYPLHGFFEFPFHVPEAKLLYLFEGDKGEVFKILGLINYSSEEIQQLIFKKMKQSYLYNLEYLEEYNVPKFNISLDLDTIDGRKKKVVVSIRYNVESKQLQLITMY